MGRKNQQYRAGHKVRALIILSAALLLWRTAHWALGMGMAYCRLCLRDLYRRITQRERENKQNQSTLILEAGFLVLRDLRTVKLWREKGESG